MLTLERADIFGDVPSCANATSADPTCKDIATGINVCNSPTFRLDPTTNKCVLAASIDCGPNATRIPLIDTKGHTTGTACGTEAKPCPSGFTFNANEQACHAVPFFKKPLFWAAVLGSVVVVGGGAYALKRRRTA